MRKLKNSLLVLILFLCCTTFVGCNDISVTLNVNYNCIQFNSGTIHNGHSTLIFHDTQTLTIAGKPGTYTKSAKFLGERRLEIRYMDTDHSVITLTAKVNGGTVSLFLQGESSAIAVYRK